MEAVRTISAGIAHHFNNLIGSMLICQFSKKKIGE